MSFEPRSQLSAEESALMAGQLAELAKAGLPLDGGLRALADEVHSPRLRRTLRDVAAQLAAGATLDAAIEAQGPRFPVHVRALVRGAVRSGRVADVFDAFAEIERSRTELRRRVWTSLAYPLTLAAMFLALFLFLEGHVVGELGKLLRDFETRLPPTTELLVRLSGRPAWWLAGGILLCATVFGATLAVPGSQRLLYAVPLIGPLYRWSMVARFARLTALLLDLRLPLPEALRLTAAGLSDTDLAAGCRRAADQVEAGQPLAEALSATKRVPPSLIPLVEWGQRNAALAEAFRSAAETFEGRAHTSALFMDTVLLPITFLAVLFGVLFLVRGIFLPMIALIQKLT